MKVLLSLLFLLISLTSCTSKYTIEGSSALSNFEGKMVFVKVYANDDWVTVDSAEIVHGLFTMKGVADSAMMATFYLDNNSVLPMVLENGKIKISMAYNELSARGTRLNDLLYDFMDRKNDAERKVYELERKEARMVLDGKNIDEVQAEIEIEREELMKELDGLVKSFIIDNGENPIGPYVFMMLAAGLPYPLMTPQIENILNDAPYALKTSPMVRDFTKKAKENMEMIREQQRMDRNTPPSASGK